MKRPAALPVPAFAVKLGLGEFGRNSVLTGQRALPARLQASGYRYTHPDLASALDVAAHP